jgi:hypothetical protein
MASFNRASADQRNAPFNVGQGNTPCNLAKAVASSEDVMRLCSAAAFWSVADESPRKIGPADDEPDFSEEFGHARGFAGGEGFENVDFERWV